MANPPPHLLIFSKAGSPGTVKTRLVPPLTTEQAHLVHRELQYAVLDLARSRALVTPILAVTPDSEAAALALLHPDFQVVPQGPGDLGDRLRRVIHQAHRRDPRPLIILGTDSPDLPPSLLREATSALETHDAALVPARDGGYCLLALRAPADPLLQNIPWGTADVMEATIAAARRARLALHQTAPWHDVDTPDDLRALLQRIADSPLPALRRLHARLVSAKLPVS